MVLFLRLFLRLHADRAQKFPHLPDGRLARHGPLMRRAEIGHPVAHDAGDRGVRPLHDLAAERLD